MTALGESLETRLAAALAETLPDALGWDWYSETVQRVVAKTVTALAAVVAADVEQAAADRAAVQGVEALLDLWDEHPGKPHWSDRHTVRAALEGPLS